MAYFTQEQIDKAKEIDVLSYLQNKNPDELVYESRGTGCIINSVGEKN